jgi:hypothetical protein
MNVKANGSYWWKTQTAKVAYWRTSHIIILHHSCSMSFNPDNNPAASKTRRVTVEDVADEDEGNLIVNRQYFEQCPDASWTLWEGQTKFEKYQQDKEDKGEYEWAPFCDK